MKRRRKFSFEQKRELVQEIETGQRTVSQVVHDEQIHPSLLGRWRKQINLGTLVDRPQGPSPRERQLERELDRYKKKVGELTMMVELLKKLDASSQYTRRSNGYVVTGMNAGASKRGAHR